MQEEGAMEMKTLLMEFFFILFQMVVITCMS